MIPDEISVLSETKTFKIFIVSVLFIVGLLFIAFSGLPDDSPIEEKIEVEIQETSGINLDLTPKTKE